MPRLVLCTTAPKITAMLSWSNGTGPEAGPPEHGLSPLWQGSTKYKEDGKAGQHFQPREGRPDLRHNHLEGLVWVGGVGSFINPFFSLGWTHESGETCRARQTHWAAPEGNPEGTFSRQHRRTDALRDNTDGLSWGCSSLCK